jgi:hypothetical protein
MARPFSFRLRLEATLLARPFSFRVKIASRCQVVVQTVVLYITQVD